MPGRMGGGENESRQEGRMGEQNMRLLQQPKREEGRGEYDTAIRSCNKDDTDRTSSIVLPQTTVFFLPKLKTPRHFQVQASPFI